MKRAQLLQRIAAAWNELQDAYAGLSETELVEPGVAGSWSVRDVIVHVTAWENEALTHLPLILEGGTPPRYSATYGGIDAFNARTMERSRALSLTQVLRQRDEVHGRLLALVEAAPEEVLTGQTRFRRRLQLDTYGHYPKHALAIRKWRARATAG